MSIPIQPSLAHIDLSTGAIAEATMLTEHRLSDMLSFFQDRLAVRELLPNNPLMYRVYLTHRDSDAHGLCTGTSVIEPGQIGREYYMTRGHFHLTSHAPEVYLTLRGHGLLLMQTRSGEIAIQSMEPGVMNYIPGEWAHRTVNTGPVQLIFFAAWPVSAGHDYDSITHSGFAQLVVAGADGPEIIVNPNFKLEP